MDGVISENMSEIDRCLVKSLIQSQFPQYGKLNIISVLNGGHDNHTFRLGTEMAVRLPSANRYVPQVEKEFEWLPRISTDISIPISIPIHKGAASNEYNFPWLIKNWISGTPVSQKNISNMDSFARELAGFLKELQNIDSRNGPIAGAHNFYRGGDLKIYNSETQMELNAIKDIFLKQRLTKIWQSALETVWEGEKMWIHGDVERGNILVKNNKLAGVIDFGMLGIGDPACDYVMAWTFFDKQSRSTFRNSLDCEEATWSRSKGWALWKALLVFNEATKQQNTEKTFWAEQTIMALLDDGEP